MKNGTRDFVSALSQTVLKGKRVDEKTGYLVNEDNCSVNFEPVFVSKGETVVSQIPFRLYFYHPEIQTDLIHTYAYDPDSNYTTYDPELSVFTEIREKTIEQDGYIRLVFECKEEKALTELVQFPDRKEHTLVQKPYFAEEQKRMAERLSTLREDEDTCLLLLADTHYGYGSVFPESAENLKKLSQEIHPEALIHLGDLTDGAQSTKISIEMTKRVLHGLQDCGVPVELCIGNHDGNYFRGNKDVFSKKRREDLYLNGRSEDRRVDIPGKDLSLLFLSTFDPTRKERYGFSAQTIWNCLWLLKGKPRKNKLLVFSHVPPVGEMHYWDPHIHNSKWMMKLLNRHQRRYHDILAYIHGHNHADSIYRKQSFPIIGIASNKPEDFLDRKPGGTTTPPRKQGDVTQECFDVLLVKKEKVYFLRYGAGEDRAV